MLGGVFATPAGAFLRAVEPSPDPAPAAAKSTAAKSTAFMPRPDRVPDDDGGFLDARNPDFSTLQRPASALQGLPMDRDGRVDWVTALRQGWIHPRASVQGDATTTVLDLDVIMRGTRAMPWVRFPHRTHTEWLDCSNCHPAPFPAGGAKLTIRMEDIFRGRYCGMCHDRVAFVTHRNCDRCHSVPQTD